MEWQVTLPCLPAMVPVARRLVRGLLPDCPRIDEAESVLTELAGNAVRYGSGELTIGVTAEAASARLTATNCGRPEQQGVVPEEVDGYADHGWSLLIVGTLADRWGFDRALDGHETLWAELSW